MKSRNLVDIVILIGGKGGLPTMNTSVNPIERVRNYNTKSAQKLGSEIIYIHALYLYYINSCILMCSFNLIIFLSLF